MKPDDLKDLYDKLEAIKKKYSKNKNKSDIASDAGDHDSAIKEEDFEEYILSLITKTDVTWDDIAGLEYAKKIINESVKYHRMKEIPDALKPWKGILLFGPPGTGKTLFAAAAAGTQKATFFNVKNLLSKFYGESSKRISALYNVARKRAPSIIFIDEFDSIGSKRNDISEASRKVLHTLLSEMDGLHNKKSSRYILTMAATNAPWDLDDAVLNRFEKRFYVPLPDTRTVMEIMKLNTKGLELDGDMLEIARTCVSRLFSGRDVAALCNEAIWNMVREDNIRPLTKSDFRKYFETIKSTITAKELKKYEDWAKEFGSYERNIPEINEPEIYRKARSKRASERKEAACEIGKYFTYFKDKKQFIKALLELTKDNNSGVRQNATEAIGSAFKYLNDEIRATNVLHALTKDEKWEVRSAAIKSLGSAFIHINDRVRVKKDLFATLMDEKWEVRSAAAKAIGYAFIHINNRGIAEKKLFDLTKYGKWEVRSAIAEAIGCSFKNLADKDRATEALLKLAEDENSFVRRNAFEAIGLAFSNVTNKILAWNDLLLLIRREDDGFVLIGAAHAIGSSFSHLSNKDKDRATKALLTLAKNKNSFVRRNAVEAIGLVFSNVTNKIRAWNDLLLLIRRENDGFVLIGAAHALGSAFPYITNNEQATEDFLALIDNGEVKVRTVAAESFGSVFPYIADKDRATEIFLALTKDENSIVRAYASHSLGRAYIFRATESSNKEHFKKELEQALQFFEKSSREETHSQPAGFCLPFYRSFYMLTFKKEEANDGVQKYLEDAKFAIEGSNSKRKLLEAVRNLGNALKEVQDLKVNFKGLKRDLNAYRRYCETAADMLNEVEDENPLAVDIVRIGLPMINERIEGILSEIKKRTEDIYERTEGTLLRNIVKDLLRQSEDLPHVRDPIKLGKKIDEIHDILLILCGSLIEKDIVKELDILNKINNEQFFENKLEMMVIVMRSILTKVK